MDKKQLGRLIYLVKTGKRKKKRTKDTMTIKSQEATVRHAKKWLERIKLWEAQFKNPQFVKKHPEHRPENLPAVKKLAKEHLARHAKILADLKNKEAIKNFEKEGQL